MNNISNNIQNPAFTATILYHFIKGYSKSKANPNMFHIYLVLPIILQSEILIELKSTRKGFYKFLQKFFDNKKNDYISNLQDSILKTKKLTNESIKLGIGTGLFNFQLDSASFTILKKTKFQSENKDIEEMMKSAEKLGKWFSEHDIFEITRNLKVSV